MISGIYLNTIDKVEVRRVVQAQDRKKEVTNSESVIEVETTQETWQDELLRVIKNITPEAFERLCQRLLRESGFIHVEVTGRSGDGGIDGKGVVRMGGLLSFHVIFQSKRYKGSVSAAVVRDFRGAMVGRADKGLLITTGTFTRDARTEAQRDGAPPIHLIDGEDLVEKLKLLSIGVEVKQRVIEDVVIKKDFFDSI